MSSSREPSWDSLKWRRRLERFGEDDGPIMAVGPNGEVDGVWRVSQDLSILTSQLTQLCSQLGELTDKGRETTLALGQRLRHLYVDQLKYMPSLISSSDSIYLRATPLPRALESVQQAFWGMYPLTARTASFPPPTIVTRTPADETLFPNEGNCRRFNQLSRAFAQRAADKWNDTEDMKYINKLIAAWMPPSSPKVAVDSHPRLSGIMDTINASLAHGHETRLPPEFYDPKAREIIETIGVDEWYSGYNENLEYRTLGIGALMGDLVERMTASIEHSGLTVHEVGGEDGRMGLGRGGENIIKFAMSGCHDTTLAAVLSSLGAFGGESWPPFTSHIALELFRKRDQPRNPEGPRPKSATEKQALASPPRPGWLASLLGLSSSSTQPSISNPQTKTTAATSEGIGRTPTPSLSPTSKARLNGYFVRLRYNDKTITIPGCAQPGNHLQGDETFCTMAAFKAIADEYTPRNWKRECDANMESATVKPAGKEEWAGYSGVGAVMAGEVRAG
jgi:acid phosphatase